MKPMDIIFIGAVLVIIGGIVGAIGTRMQNKSSSAKSDKQLKKIEDLNELNIKLSASVNNLSLQNSELATKLSSLSEQNSKLISDLSNARLDVDKARKEAIDNTFGSKGAIFVAGNSYGKLFNESLLPVYDAKIFLTHYDELLKCKTYKDQYGQLGVSKDCYHSTTKIYTVPIIYGNTVMDFTDFIIDIKTSFKVSIKFITKKGT